MSQDSSLLTVPFAVADNLFLSNLPLNYDSPANAHSSGTLAGHREPQKFEEYRIATGIRPSGHTHKMLLEAAPVFRSRQPSNLIQFVQKPFVPRAWHSAAPSPGRSVGTEGGRILLHSTFARLPPFAACSMLRCFEVSSEENEIM